MTTTGNASPESSNLTFATIATYAIVAASITVGSLLVRPEGPWWVSLLIGLVAALALVVGVWFAPPTSLVSGTGKRSLTPSQARMKIAQLIAGAVTAIASSLLFSGVWRASAAIIGIVVAGVVGAAWRPKDDHSDTAGPRENDGAGVA